MSSLCPDQTPSETGLRPVRDVPGRQFLDVVLGKVCDVVSAPADQQGLKFRASLRQSSRYRFHIRPFPYIVNCLENSTVTNYSVNFAVNSIESAQRFASQRTAPPAQTLFGWPPITPWLITGSHYQLAR